MKDASHKANDVNIIMQLTIEESYSGALKKIKYQRREVCSFCENATGKKSKEGCSHCNGKQYLIKEVLTEVNIPAGVDEGMKMSLKEKGHFIPEKKNGLGFLNTFFQPEKKQFGNLNIRIAMLPHPEFSREGADLIVECPLQKMKLPLGLNHEIQLPDKSTVKIAFPADTTEGRVFRIKGKGFLILSENTAGNLLIIAKIIDL